MKTTTLFVVIYKEKGEALWKIAGDDFYESYETAKEQEDLFRSSCFVKTLSLGCEVKIVPLRRWFYINEEQRKLHNKGVYKTLKTLRKIVSKSKKCGESINLYQKEKSFMITDLEDIIEIFPIDEINCKVVFSKFFEGASFSEIMTYDKFVATIENSMKEVRL